MQVIVIIYPHLGAEKCLMAELCKKNADSFLKYASVVTLDKITSFTYSKLRQRNKIKVKLINHSVWQSIEERETLTFNEKVNTIKHNAFF